MAEQNYEAYLKSITLERVELLNKEPSHQTNPDFEDTITYADVERVMGYAIKWGKYKGTTYREILVKYPAYFHKTVISFLEKHPSSYTYRCFKILIDNGLKL